MGAYENPPIINVPNFSELFTRNFMSLYKVGEARREKEAKAELLRQQNITKQQQDILKQRQKVLDETEAQRKDVSELASGTTLDNLGSAMNSGVDFIYKVKDDYAQGKTSFEEYTSNLNKGNAFINQLTDATKSFNGFYENVKSNQNLSRFQPKATQDVLGILSSIENNDGDVAYNSDFTNPRLVYKNPLTGESKDVDMKALRDPNAYVFNEVFDASETTEAISKLIEAQKTKSVSATKTDDLTKEVTKDVWNKGFDTPEARIEKAYNSKLIQGLNENELGSYYMDTVVNSRGKDYKPEEDMELMQATEGLSEEARNNIFDIVEAKGFSREDITDGKNTVNAGDILLDYAKRKLAKASVEEINEAEAVTQVKTTKDLTNKEPTKLQESRSIAETRNKNFQENKLTNKSWDDIVNPKPIKYKNIYSGEREAREGFFRDYIKDKGLELISFEVMNDEDYGFEVKDVYTGEKTVIMMNDPVEVVNRKISGIKRLEIKLP